MYNPLVKWEVIPAHAVWPDPIIFEEEFCMKKLLALILSLVMVLSLVACGAKDESSLRSAPYFDLRIDGITELNA